MRQPLLTGLDVLQQEGFLPLQGKKAALVTNHTGINGWGQAGIDLLRHAPNVEMKALFSPEHGIRGQKDETIGDSFDQASDLPVYSLYGERTRPAPEQLQGLDILIYDIQDIGCRFYTYISTMLACMEAAEECGVEFLVLDRPNPVNGVDVEGPLSSEQARSFVACHPLPLRHGLTIAELALLFQKQKGLQQKPLVSPMRGWKREMLWQDTGLLWVNPSPNMRSQTQALLYPGVALPEFTNISVGRGTSAPFQYYGAPWVNPAELAKALLPSAQCGAVCMPTRFTPAERQYAGEECGGVQIERQNRSVQSVRLGFLLLTALVRLYPADWQHEKLGILLACPQIEQALLAGAQADELEEMWKTSTNRFMQQRTEFLLYD